MDINYHQICFGYITMKLLELPLQMLTLLAQQLQWRLQLNKRCKRRLLRSVCDLGASAD